MHVIITGYYKKENLGDDLFEQIAKKIWESKKFKKEVLSYKIIPIDKINLSENRSPLDRVILFGGETLNDYFIDKLIELWIFNKNIKFNAIGVSCNQIYNEILNKLHIFESIGFRSKKDYDFFKGHIDSFFCPDIVFSLNKVTQNIIKKKKHIVFFLSQTAIANLDKKSEIVYTLTIANFIRYLINLDFKIYLFAMCTNEKQQEDDNIINIKVLDHFTEHEKSFVEAYASNKKVLQKINKIKYAICWRYHAHILCMINNVPFISISNTPKVIDLLKEICLVNLSVNLSVNLKNLEKKFEELIKNKKSIKLQLKNMYKEYNKQTKIYNNQDIYLKNKTENTFYIEPKNYWIIFNYIINQFNKLKEKNNNDDITANTWFNTQIITFFFTRSLENDYNFGLSEKISKGIENLKEDIYWLITDSIQKKNLYFYNSVSDIFNMPNNSNNSNYQNNKNDIEINIQFINQNDYKGLHRSGWQYVVDSLGQFQSNNSNNSMICDLYLDRTFHWNYDEYKKLGIIPYTKNWIGFIHHTTDEEYTSYNTINLFKNKLFLLSLQHCRGLFVLSNELKHKIENILYNANIKINIYSLIHPTESVSEANLFTIKKFLTNPSRKIIQVGAWMRVINAINKINLCKNTLLLEKYALRGKKMDNYYYIDDNTPRISHTSNVLDLTNLTDNSDNSYKSNKNSTDISDAYIDIDDDFTVSSDTVNKNKNCNRRFIFVQ